VFQVHFAKTIAIIRAQIARAFARKRPDIDGKGRETKTAVLSPYG
jgi:hypothetical protein